MNLEAHSYDFATGSISAAAGVRSDVYRGKSSAGNRSTTRPLEGITSQASTACKCRANSKEFSKTSEIREKSSVF
jgi:hypothetical protein